MSYEIIGKLAITAGILILIPIILVIEFIFFDWLSDKTKKLPEILRTIIAFSLLGLIIICVGVLIYNVL